MITLLPARRPHPLTGYPAALCIILLLYTLGLAASRANSQTFDEAAHLVGGYIHLTLGHPRIHTENGYLSQAIAALPLLFTHPNLPDTSSEAFQHAQPFALGRDFFYNDHNNPAQLLLLGRAAIGFLTALTALTIYTWSRQLFSPIAAIVSVLLFSLSPLVLSHGFLITSDMPVTCFFILSLAAFTWTLQRITLLRFTLTAVSLTALFLAKMSAPLILPVLFLLALLPRIQPAVSNGAAKGVLKNFTLLLALSLAVWILLYAAYGFTFSAFKDSPPGSGQTLWPLDQWSWALARPNVLLHGIGFTRDHRLLPESYLYGYAYVVQTGRTTVSFANGHISHTGWWWFYPYVFLITTPLPLLAFLLLAATRSLAKLHHFTGASLRLAAQRTAPLTLFILTYSIAAILSYRGSGPRHLLPLYPMLCILAGAAIHNLAAASLFLKKILPTVLLLWLALDTILLYPHYLTSTNELAGPPSNAYRRLVDSATDWGQDLPALSVYLAKAGHDPASVYLSYFGSADPAAYNIRANMLPSFLPRPEEPALVNPPPLHAGLYCISITMLQNLYADQLTPTPRTHDFTRLCTYLQTQEPLAQAGHSINIYDVTPQDLAIALSASEGGR